MTISVEEVTDRGQLPALRAEWSRLVADVPTAELFSTPEWITSWLDAFWVDHSIRFLLARDAGRLVGLAPLLVDELGTLCCRGAFALPVDAVSWRAEILQAPDATDAVLDAFLGYLGDHGSYRLNLSRIAVDSPTAHSLRVLAENRQLGGIWREEHRTPVIRLPGSVEEYLQSRSKHVRHELRRKRRKLENEGEVQVRIVQRADELDTAFDQVRVIEANSWKGEAESSFLDAPFAESFYRDLFAKTVHQGWVRIYVMYFDGRPVAHLFGMVFRDRYYAFNSSFDAGLGQHSPGSVLILRAIEDACAQGFEVFDFMGSEYRWKDEMATDIREHLDVCIFTQFASACGVHWAMDQHVKPLVRRHLPVLVSAKRKLVEPRRNRRLP